MTGWTDAYPYSAEDPAESYEGNFEVWDWLDYTIPEEWEFFNGRYNFKTEKALILFKLRWM